MFKYRYVVTCEQNMEEKSNYIFQWSINIKFQSKSKVKQGANCKLVVKPKITKDFNERDQLIW